MKLVQEKVTLLLSCAQNKMEQKQNTKYLVWILPIVYIFHLIEEYFGGEGLPLWLSEFIKAEISNLVFIIINSIALTIVVVFAFIYSFIKQINVLFLALITLFFVNGLLHLFLSIYTFSYSPGTITGVILYLPMGIYLYKLLRPELTNSQRSTGITLGIVLHILVVLIAWNI